MRVLTLNADYSPLHIISEKRALLLVLADKAEIVEDSDRVYTSEKLAFTVPSVIRLFEYKHVPYARRVALTTRAVLRRDDYECCFCGERATTRDHVVPTARGGRNDWKNVVAACKPCNNRKDDKLVSELGWKMRYQPFEPEGVPQFAKLAADSRPEWTKYFEPFLKSNKPQYA